MQSKFWFRFRQGTWLCSYQGGIITGSGKSVKEAYLSYIAILNGIHD